MSDPYGIRGFTKVPTHFILFRQDGSFTEHAEAPEPPDLTSYVYARHVGEWFEVVIYPPFSLKWQTVEEDYVPAGLRAMLILIE